MMIRNAVTRRPRFRTMGFRVNFDHLMRHLDDDEALTRRVLLDAGFTPVDDGERSWRAGANLLEDSLGFDALVAVVDFHRPV